MVASGLLINGSAGMQFMGDWAKPTFMRASKRSGWAFDCAPAPGTAQYFLFATDAFAVFKPAGAAATQAQLDFASVAMSKEVQASFNQAKGSTPVRLDVDTSQFDHCGVIAANAYRRAVQTGQLLPNVAPSTRPDIELTIPAITSAFWRDERITPAMTMTRLVRAVRPGR
jgi:glucose/mannose transport system substrate-binding protein